MYSIFLYNLIYYKELIFFYCLFPYIAFVPIVGSPLESPRMSSSPHFAFAPIKRYFYFISSLILSLFKFDLFIYISYLYKFIYIDRFLL